MAPKDPSIRYHLGKALAEAGDKAQARKTLQEALSLTPNFPAATDAQKLLDSLGTP
ncbi:hypothetical protein D9M68_890060 [compost metagenome]